MTSSRGLPLAAWAGLVFWPGPGPALASSLAMAGLRLWFCEAHLLITQPAARGGMYTRGGPVTKAGRLRAAALAAEGRRVLTPATPGAAAGFLE
jgi:hypothetical protein